MDTKLKKTALDPDAFQEAGETRRIAGVKQIRKALLAGQVRTLCLAKNADPALTEPLEALSRQNHVPVFWACSMEELGRAWGIEVGTAAAAVLKSN